MDTNNTSTVRQTQRVDAKVAKRILRDELQRLDVETVIVGVYWNGGYRAVHLDVAQAREFMRAASA